MSVSPSRLSITRWGRKSIQEQVSPPGQCHSRGLFVLARKEVKNETYKQGRSEKKPKRGGERRENEN